MSLSAVTACQPLKPSSISHIVKPVTPAVLAAVESKQVPEVPLVPPAKLTDCSLEPCLALTFDDGPDARTTPQLLDILAAQQVKATFFMLGSQVVKFPDLARQVERAGHEVGGTQIFLRHSLSICWKTCSIPRQLSRARVWRSRVSFGHPTEYIRQQSSKLFL